MRLTAEWGPLTADLGWCHIHRESDKNSLLWMLSTDTDLPADTLTMSLPESEDTEDAEEPEERSWGQGRDKVRCWV